MDKRFEQIFDEWLVIRYYSGDRNAFPLLVKRWHKKLLGRIMVLTQNLEATKDIGQECWRHILKNLNAMKIPTNFGPWAMTIASRKAIDWVRLQQSNRKHFDSDNTSLESSADKNADSDFDNQQLINLMKIEMRNLTNEQRAILSLFYLDKLDLKHISDVLRIPVGTVKSRLFHAREHLKKRLTERISHEE